MFSLRRIGWLSILCMMISMTAAFAAVAAPDADKLTAQAVILIEADTGKILYEKNAETRMYPASTTKIMTTILALEKGRLEDIITVSENAARTGGSSMELASHDRVALGDALYGVMMVSGNDAAVATAEHIAGSVDAFAVLMNEKAQKLGAVRTHFANSCGLPNPQHYTTAHDLSRIAAYAYQNPVFRQMIATKFKELSWREKQKPILLENTNLLLGNYQGINGMKTGYTEAAGECLVASAERDGINLIAVVLHAAKDYRWYEAAALLDYGFDRVKMETLAKKENMNAYVRVQGGDAYRVQAYPSGDIQVPVVDGDKNNYSIKVETPAVEAPIAEGQVVGKVNVLYKGQMVEQVDLLAQKEVEAGFSILAVLAGYVSDALQWIK